MPEPRGDIAVKLVGETTVTELAATPPKNTDVPVEVKFAPVTLTVVPPAAGPVPGETPLTVGAVPDTVPLQVTPT